MRFLKNKIEASLKARKKPSPRPTRNNSLTTPSTEQTKANGRSRENFSNQPKKRKRIKGDAFTPKMYLETKNIVTNFGKQMAAFAASDLALPYLEDIVKKLTSQGEKIKLSSFQAFIGKTRGNISSIDSLRSLVLETETDSETTILCKKVFRMISEVFIKYFSVNWIIHGRITYKMPHLKFRYKMLRRIQNPSCFTYLKGYEKKMEKLKDDE